jgi:hypothetical protein
MAALSLQSSSTSPQSQTATCGTKTGQLVDATPWKRQFALIVGVIAGAWTPVLDLVNCLRFRRRAGADCVRTVACAAGRHDSLARESSGNIKLDPLAH